MFYYAFLVSLVMMTTKQLILIREIFREVQSATCFSSKSTYPILITGADTFTSVAIKSIDVDSTGNYLAFGGTAYSTTNLILIGMVSTITGNYKWAHSYDQLQSGYFNAIKIDTVNSKVFAFVEQSPIHLIVFDLSTGSIKKFLNLAKNGFITPRSVVIDSTGNIIFAYSSASNNQWTLNRLTASKYQQNYQLQTQTNFKTQAINVQESGESSYQIIVGGSYDGYAQVTQVDLTSSSGNQFSMITFGGYTVSQFVYDTGTGMIYMLAEKYGFGMNSADSKIKISYGGFSSATGGCTYYDLSNSLKIQLISLYMNSDGDIYFYMFNYDTSSQNQHFICHFALADQAISCIPNVNFQSSVNHLYDATYYYDSSSNTYATYFAGQYQYIKATTLSKGIGMIMGGTYSQSCITESTGSTISASMNPVIEFLGGTCHIGNVNSDSSMSSFTISTSVATFSAATYTEQWFQSDSSTFEICPAQTLATSFTLSAPSYSRIDYYAGQGSILFSLADFTSSASCSDATLIYSAKAYDTTSSLEITWPSYATLSSITGDLTLFLASTASVIEFYVEVSAYVKQSSSIVATAAQFLVHIEQLTVNCQNATLETDGYCSSQNYIANNGPYSYSFTPFDVQFDLECTVVYSLTSVTHSFMSFSDSSQTFTFTPGTSDIGSYNVDIIGYIDENPSHTQYTCTFTVDVKDICSQNTLAISSINSSYSYDVQAPIYVLDTITITSTPNTCTETYTLTDDTGNLINLNAITYNSANGSFLYNTTLMSSISSGSYSFKYKISLDRTTISKTILFYITVKNPTSSFSSSDTVSYTNGFKTIMIGNIQVNITDNFECEPPYFSSPLINQVLDQGDHSNYQLPSIQDPKDCGNYELKVDTSKAPMVEYSKAQNALSISPSNHDSGTFTVQFTISIANQYPSCKSEDLLYIIISSTIADNQNSTNSTNSTNNQNNNQSQSDQGDNNQNSVQPQVTDPNKLSKTLKASITKIEKNGRVKVAFSKEIFVPKNYQTFNDKILRLSIDSNNDQEQDLLGFSWSIVDFTSKEMIIKIKFENPLYISRPNKDKLTIVFLLNGYFQETQNNQFIPYHHEISGQIPKQLSTDSFSEGLEGASSGFGTATTAFLTTNFAANLILGSKVTNWLLAMVIWNNLIRYYLETYIEFTIDTYINIIKYDFSSPSNTVSTVLAFISLVSSLGFPLFVYIFLKKNKFKIRVDIGFDKKYDSLYEGVKDNLQIYLLLNVFFILRRLIYCSTLVLLVDYPYTQILMQIFQSMFILIYLILYKPFYSRINNYIEMFNEICILIVNYHLFLFTDYVKDYNMQYTLGWSVIAVTLFNIICNMGIVFWRTIISFKILIHELRKRYKNRKAKKSQLYESNNQSNPLKNHPTSLDTSINKSFLSQREICQDEKPEPLRVVELDNAYEAYTNEPLQSSLRKNPTLETTQAFESPQNKLFQVRRTKIKSIYQETNNYFEKPNIQ